MLEDVATASRPTRKNISSIAFRVTPQGNLDLNWYLTLSESDRALAFNDLIIKEDQEGINYLKNEMQRRQSDLAEELRAKIEQCKTNDEQLFQRFQESQEKLGKPINRQILTLYKQLQKSKQTDPDGIDSVTITLKQELHHEISAVVQEQKEMLENRQPETIALEQDESIENSEQEEQNETKRKKGCAKCCIVM